MKKTKILTFVDKALDYLTDLIVSIISHAAELALAVAIFCIIGLCGSWDIGRITGAHCAEGIFFCSLCVIVYVSLYFRMPAESRKVWKENQRQSLLDRFLARFQLLDEEYDEYDDECDDPDADCYDGDDDDFFGL